MTEPALHPAVRTPTEDDLGTIRQLILDLADYERSSSQVRVTEEQLRQALFGPQPAAYALVVEEAGGEVAGFALYFLNFSTWEGVHGIYLEDLYVRPEYRGTGLGKALLQSLARIAVSRGYARFEWSVLDWNAPSIAFYRSLGAEPMTDWTVFRLTGDSLARLGGLGEPGQRQRSGDRQGEPGDSDHDQPLGHAVPEQHHAQNGRNHHLDDEGDGGDRRHGSALQREGEEDHS
ncbi:GNAT superfamily N-acetyltransferase [Microlunatus panaciterrae]|uniref:GNAT superfamily N-acetyltransferase n=1 Tax=Microlunatus panaciterrae TaxID=400768 RepID=A0ABS2RKI7_9ACTN|nr:GNAT superfamily N-acetyltransferase [Microlunatus panaciterrae]